MIWYMYLLSFLAGIFLTNAIPHFVHGISGNKFPTPFAKPHGIGLSSSTTNVIWALVNLIVGFLLLKLSHFSSNNYLQDFTLFLGISFISLFSSKHFMKKHKE
ncbi:hypothetical protein [Rhizosphaericola mali]|uniref:Uncharacterized protein n=1 Tax=Rhizosphaericola mali TaxID=2545455 RepID=A0A5P2G853_9BACT|nr:hypothetical protein [Rhizosphaericola mali]QES87701.1 hypothetical protein E0W69_003150 [Rhizosphaericola mali]